MDTQSPASPRGAGAPAPSALKLVCIGGGTGMPQLLSGLKMLARAEGPTGPVDLRQIVALVSAFDDGGSSGRLMATYDTLPPGDLRNCLVALADEEAEPLMTRFLNHRFGDEDRADPLSGHSVGNLLLLALAQVYNGDMRQALLNVHRILPIQSRILFPTLSPAVLCARLEDGTIIRGESNIGHRRSASPIERIFLTPRPPHAGAPEDGPAPSPPPSDAPFDAPPMPGVVEALEDADLIAMGPGSLYTSVLPHLLVGEVAETIRRNAHKVVYVCNIMNEAGETDRFGVEDFVRAIEAHGGFVPRAVLVNDAPISETFYRAYAKERLALQAAQLHRVLDEGIDDALDTLSAAPLKEASAALTRGLKALGAQIDSATLARIQVLPPESGATLPGGTRVVPIDLLGSTELMEQGKSKRVIRHDPVKLARALVSLARTLQGS